LKQIAVVILARILAAPQNVGPVDVAVILEIVVGRVITVKVLEFYIVWGEEI
jgi:hypothetical protein